MEMPFVTLDPCVRNTKIRDVEIWCVLYCRINKFFNSQWNVWWPETSQSPCDIIVMTNVLYPDYFVWRTQWVIKILNPFPNIILPNHLYQHGSQCESTTKVKGTYWHINSICPEKCYISHCVSRDSKYTVCIVDIEQYVYVLITGLTVSGVVKLHIS